LQHLHSFPTRRSSDLGLCGMTYSSGKYIVSTTCITPFLLKSKRTVTIFVSLLYSLYRKTLEITSVLLKFILKCWHVKIDFIETRSEEHTSELQSRFDL